MKKTIIAMAVAAVVSAPLALQAAPTLYGQANMMIQSDAAPNGDITIGNTGSRIGLKGSEDLGNDLKAIYKLEFGVNMADRSRNAEGVVTEVVIRARNQYVGLSGNFGTVLMGRHTTPLNMSFSSDLFDAHGQSDVTLGALGSRLSNIAAYVSPSFGGVKLILAVQPNGAADSATSAAITFGSKSDGLYLAAGMASVDTTGTDDYTAFSAQYVIAGLTSSIMHRTVGAGFQNTSTNTIISFGYEMGDFFPKIRYSMNEETDNSNMEGAVLSFGVDYSLGKNTATYIEVDMFDEDFNRSAGNGNESHTAVSVGLLHKF